MGPRKEKEQSQLAQKLTTELNALGDIIRPIINDPNICTQQTIIIIFTLTAKAFGCRSTSIVMPAKVGIGSRRATPARHFLIHLVHKQIKWDTYKTAALFKVSDGTVATTIIKFNEKIQKQNKNYYKSRNAIALITKEFTTKKRLKPSRLINTNQLTLNLEIN